MVRETLVCAVLLLACAAGASAQDHRAEIMEQVIDRCYRATVSYYAMVRAPKRRNATAESEMVRILKDAPHTQHLLAALTETVRGKDSEQRRALYDIAFVNCFVSGGEDLP